MLNHSCRAIYRFCRKLDKTRPASLFCIPSKGCAGKSSSEEEEGAVLSHYHSGTLLERIEEALKSLGTNLESMQLEDLHGLDQFHVGGLDATNHMLEQLPIRKGMTVLDMGCGLGGVSRHVLHSFPGVTVHGIDITGEYVDVAQRLSAAVGMPNIHFAVGSVLQTSYASETFDVALMVHVGMNIRDKSRLFLEAYRLLRPGGTFGVYDVMWGSSRSDSDRANNNSPSIDSVSESVARYIQFPTPWASSPTENFVESIEDYVEVAEAAQFQVVRVSRRGSFTKSYFAKLREIRMRLDSRSAPLTLAITMGNKSSQKLENLTKLIRADVIEPVEIIFKKPE